MQHHCYCPDRRAVHQYNFYDSIHRCGNLESTRNDRLRCYLEPHLAVHCSSARSAIVGDSPAEPSDRGWHTYQGVPKLRALQKKERRALRKIEIRPLQAAGRHGSAEPTDEPGAKRRRTNDALTIQRAKDVKLPDEYDGSFQKALDLSLEQAESAFRQNSLIYSTSEEQCAYAERFLKGTP